eukprot:TRINITY_DN23217_c0_g1_i1.p1 TRINITY_DN23217_c0_g1~~TRINITY_DN23217_c0_g1_i1.p1  ORF type:complete len:213 (+),score=20.37 TRINITY_DN23217_c0_g1_i1:35-673(+)
MKAFLLLCLLLAFVFGQKNGCEFATNFQAQQSVTGYDAKGCIQYFEYGDIFIDSTNQRTRADAHGSVPGVGPIGVSVYSFYQTKKQFVYDDTTKQCHVSPLTDKFPEVKFPPNAKFFNDVVFGAETIYIYVDEVKAPQPARVTIGTTTETVHCAPVFIDLYNTTTGLPFFVEGFNDWIPQVPGSAFELPSACKAAITEPHPSAPQFLAKKFF